MFESLNPETISSPLARYAHGVSFPVCGNIVMTSGQLPLYRDGSIPEGAAAQAELCFENIDEILKDAAASRSNVVKINAFVTDRAHMAGYMKARDAWLAEIDVLPASTLVIVSGFTREEFLVEIEVVALLPKAKTCS